MFTRIGDNELNRVHPSLLSFDSIQFSLQTSVDLNDVVSNQIIFNSLNVFSKIRIDFEMIMCSI
jgi:hypothetical protein